MLGAMVKGDMLCNVARSVGVCVVCLPGGNLAIPGYVCRRLPAAEWSVPTCSPPRRRVA